MWIFAVLVVVFLFIVFSCIRIVPQETEFVIERLGKFNRCMDAGINFMIPMIESVAKKVTRKEQVYDFPPQPVITKDNVAVRIDAVVFLRVFDSKMYTYGATNPIQGIENLSATTLRSIVGSLEFDQTLTSRDSINAEMLTALDQATDPWGIKVTRVEVKNIQPPQDILDVMQKQMTAERERRQAVLEAEGYKQASITHAEGDKQAKILAAEAEAESMKAIAEGRAQSIKTIYDAEAEGLSRLMNVGVSKEVLRLKAIEAMKDVANGNATKIFFPTDLTEIARVGLSGESFDMNGVVKPALKDAPAYVDPAVHKSKIGSSHITEMAIQAGHHS